MFDGAAVDGDGGEVELACFGENLIEPVGGLCGVVEGAAEFDAEGEVADGVADFAEDGDGGFRIGKEVSAAASAEDFADGAGEVEVDDIEARVDQNFGSGGEFVGFGAHQLAGNGVIFIAEDGTFFAAAAATEEDLIEQCFGDGVGAAATAGDAAHGHVGISGETGLHRRDAEREGADATGTDARRVEETQGVGRVCGHAFPLFGGSMMGDSVAVLTLEME